MICPDCNMNTETIGHLPSCEAIREHEPAECCECGGQGFIEDGGCGGGCEFCRPFPKCNACDGTGRTDVHR